MLPVRKCTKSTTTVVSAFIHGITSVHDFFAWIFYHATRITFTPFFHLSSRCSHVANVTRSEPIIFLTPCSAMVESEGK